MMANSEHILLSHNYVYRELDIHHKLIKKLLAF